MDLSNSDGQKVGRDRLKLRWTPHSAAGVASRRLAFFGSIQGWSLDKGPLYRKVFMVGHARETRAVPGADPWSKLVAPSGAGSHSRMSEILGTRDEVMIYLVRDPGLPEAGHFRCQDSAKEDGGDSGG